MVLGCEVGGRWSQPALEVLRNLAAAKSREAPPLLRRSAALAWHRRWLSHLSVAAQLALAETLVAPLSPHLSAFDAVEPFLGTSSLIMPVGSPPRSAACRFVASGKGEQESWDDGMKLWRLGLACILCVS